MKKQIALLALLTLGLGLKAQQKTGTVSSADSLLNSMSSDEKPQPVHIFKATRLILSQTTEMIKRNEFNFQIIHRFGDMAGTGGGPETAFGLDRVNDVYFGFEYGVSDNFNIDLGRSTIGQLVQLEAKLALVHQTNTGSSPIAITALGEIGARPYTPFPTFSSRLSYLGQLVFAHQFVPGFALQVSPSYLRDNTPYPNIPGNSENLFSLQAGSRLKLTNHTSLLLDYAHPFSSFRNNSATFQDPMAIGYEVETGGHVFTINLSNANAVSEINMLSNTQQKFSKGQYRIGFTISRMFDFNPKDKKEKKM